MHRQDSDCMLNKGYSHEGYSALHINRDTLLVTLNFEIHVDNVPVYKFRSCRTADTVVLQYETNLWLILRRISAGYIENCIEHVNKLITCNVEVKEY